MPTDHIRPCPVLPDCRLSQTVAVNQPPRRVVGNVLSRVANVEGKCRLIRLLVAYLTLDNITD